MSAKQFGSSSAGWQASGASWQATVWEQIFTDSSKEVQY